MPTVDVVVQCPVYRSFHVEQLAGMFDVPLEEKLSERFRVEIPALEEDWLIGVIVGDCIRWDGPGDGRAGQAGFLAGFDQHNLADDPLATGPWCWILRNPRRLPQPLFCRGARGLWDCKIEPPIR